MDPTNERCAPADGGAGTNSGGDAESTRAVRTFRCCGVSVAALSRTEAVAHLRSLTRVGAARAVHLCNAYTLSLAVEDDRYREMLNNGLNLADGTPVAWVGRSRGHANLTGPVRGTTLMLDVMRDGVTWGARHYLYGSTPEVIDALRLRLPELVPGVALAGLESPPFRDPTDSERAAVVTRVCGSGAHYVWVGLGTPKQDHFISAHHESWSAVTIAVGAAFDFVSGTRREAPRWLHGTGLEWVHRLVTEPRRLWRRYLVGNARFVAAIATRRD